MALNGITMVGTSGIEYPNHMIEHAMSAVTDCAHGAGLSVIMPAWMKWYKDRNLGVFERFAREIFGLKTADEGIEALKAWFDKIGTPTRLSQLKIDSEALINEIAGVAYENAKAWAMQELYPKKNIVQILELAK